MLIFVSDLHLVDHPGRASFKVPPFLGVVRSIAERNDNRDDAITLVLLGDIFELLKSDAWHRHSIRPWSMPGAQLSAVTCEILRGIRRENPDFFVGLCELQQDHGVSLAYLPGNHDALVGDPEVSGVRSLLRSLLPGLDGDGEQPFALMLLDEEHGVYAEHGHELDSFNRRFGATGRFVPGDAVVVELVVQLPIEVARESGAGDALSEQFDPQYAFLHEMDNVEPQTLDGFMRWLEYQMYDVADRRSAEGAIARALRRCADNLRAAMKAHGASALARRTLRVLVSHRAFTRMPVLRTLAKLPVTAPTEMSAVAGRVRVIGGARHVWTRPPDLYVAGHTHVPLERGFATVDGHRMIYLNSGTWRRVQAPALSGGRVVFHESYQETVLCVHRTRLAATKGRYELRRYARG